jgi:hypothetical protein
MVLMMLTEISVYSNNVFNMSGLLNGSDPPYA